MTVDQIPDVLKNNLRWAPMGDDKVAIHAHNGDWKASVTDLTNWDDFHTVRAKLNGSTRAMSGLLQKGFIVIDLDGTEDLPDGSLVKQKHRDVLNAALAAGHYIEISQSGNGYHIVFQGSLPFAGRKSSAHQFEIYEAKRYINFTGNMVSGATEIKPDETGFVAMFVEFFGQRDFDTADIEWKDDPRSVDLIIKALLASNGNPKGKQVWESGFPAGCDQSQEDARVAEAICYVTQDFEKIMTIFKMGKHWGPDREAKDQRHKGGYVPRTVEFAGSNVIARRKEKIKQAQVAIEQNASVVAEVKSVEPTELMPAEYGALTALYNHCTYNPHVNFPEAALATSLAHISSILGSNYITPLIEDGLNLYVSVIAHSGWGKDTVISKARGIVKEASSVHPFITDRLSPQFGSRQQMQDDLSQQSTMVLWLREFGKVLKHSLGPKNQGHQTELFRFMTSIYTASAPGEFLEEHKVRESDKSVDAVERPCLSIIGEATPQDFNGVDPNSFGDGTTARYLYFKTDKRPPYNDLNFIDYEAAKWVGQLFEQVTKLDGLITPKITPEARDFFFKKRAENDENYDRVILTDVVYAACLRRFMQQVMKLATIGVVCRDPQNPVVELRDLQWSAKVTELCMRNIREMLTVDVGQTDNDDGVIVENFKSYIWRWGTTDFRLRDPKNYSAFKDRMDVLPKGYLRNSLSPKQRKHTLSIDRAIKVLLEDGILVEFDESIHGPLKIGVTPRKNVKYFINDLEMCRP